MEKLAILGIEGFPLVKEGDDLAELIVSAAERDNIEIIDGDVFVVAQKVVSKAEGRVVRLSKVKPSKRAIEIADRTTKDSKLIELVLRDSKRLLKATKEIIIVEDNRGIVNINAGIDKSNIDGKDCYALLPVHPDESARKLRSGITALTGKNTCVIISDTYSRAFRRGQVNFAVGFAGINPFVDYRGTQDLFGYVMRVKFAAVADELAAAAELVMGQGKEAIPVVIVRGVRRLCFSDEASFSDLVINEDEDLFQHVW